MDKNEAFQVLIHVVSQFRGTIAECNAVQEAVSVLAKELKYEPKESEPEEEGEDLEKSIRKDKK